MEAQSYTEFSAGLHERLARRRLPLNGTIEVTRRCPLACAHCYNNLALGDRAARAAELTLDEHRRILDEIAEAGCLWLLYTGGEIFARKDFLHIYRQAKRRGLLVTLFTNATLITDAIADALREHPPFSIEVTLYGRTEETYERLTGVSGSYARCLRGIERLTARGLPVKLKTVAVTLNRHEIEDMKTFAENELGLEFKFDAMINPRIDCSNSPLAVRLSPAEVVELDLRDVRRVAEWRRFAARFNGPAHSAETRDELYHCGGGINAFAIDPYGRLSICVLSQMDTYDLRQGSFRDGWEHFLLRVRRRTISRPTKCRTCHLTAMCGMCPANGELENGDPEAPVDFLCQVAHLRALALGLAVPPHGACAYCPGGAGAETLRRAADALQAKPRAAAPAEAHGQRGAPAPAAPSCTTGGCASCGLAAAHNGGGASRADA
jgi:radical SAM protein with 4Fe4S-binding SPASM domain